jgi:hypothetical protein
MGKLHFTFRVEALYAARRCGLRSEIFISAFSVRRRDLVVDLFRCKCGRVGYGDLVPVPDSAFLFDPDIRSL